LYKIYGSGRRLLFNLWLRVFSWCDAVPGWHVHRLVSRLLGVDSRRMDRLLDVPPPGLTHWQWRRISHPLGFMLARNEKELMAWVLHVLLDELSSKRKVRP